MINNKCFYVSCSNGFIAYVWADTPAKAKTFVFQNKLSSCYPSCGGVDCLKVFRCASLDNKYEAFANFCSYIKKPRPEMFIDGMTQSGCDFLTIFCSDIVSFTATGYILEFHHNNRAKVKFDLETLESDGGNEGGID